MAAQVFDQRHGEGRHRDAQPDPRIVNIAQPGAQVVGQSAEHQGRAVNHNDGAGHARQEPVDGPGSKGAADPHENTADDTDPEGDPERGAGPVRGHCHGKHGPEQVAPVVHRRQVAAGNSRETGAGNHVRQGGGKEKAANAQGDHQTEGASDGNKKSISVAVGHGRVSGAGGW